MEQALLRCWRNNPFISEERLVKHARESTLTLPDCNVWAQEKRGFEYWYDFERFGYQGNLIML